MPDPGRAVAELLRHGHDRGLRITPQRLAIYRALAESPDHPDPDTLHRRLRETHPTMSLATVYKTLDALVAVGLVRQVPAPGAAKRYDANRDRHHHLICERCRSVTDIHDGRLDRTAVPPDLRGFDVREISVQILGTCADCTVETRRERRSMAKTKERRQTLSPGKGETTWPSR